MLDFFKRNKNFYIESFIYIDECGRCVKKELANTIKCLEKFTVVAKTEDEADKKAFKILEEKYPHYKGGIWIL